MRCSKSGEKRGCYEHVCKSEPIINTIINKKTALINMTKPVCPLFKICSGCEKDLDLSIPLVWQEVVDFSKALVDPILIQGAATGWRCRAKLAVRGTVENPLIGLFKKNSHEVVPIPLCPVHHPKINEAVEQIRQWMIKQSIVPYQEEKGKGDLRYIQLVVEQETKRVQATFVINKKDVGDLWKEMVSQLFTDHPDLWHSLWFNFNDRQTNTIFGPTWLKVMGEEYLWEKFGTVEICYKPATFGQANLDLFEKMLQQLYQWIPQNGTVVEYYAGVGAIGLYIASKCAWIRCEEANPHAEECFEISLQRLSKKIRDRMSYHTLPAEKSFHLMEEAATVIVDPPRKGLTPQFIKAVTDSSASQLIYVSCGWEAFKRDCQDLLSKEWVLKQLQGYTFFPGSNHIELIAEFHRIKIIT